MKRIRTKDNEWVVSTNPHTGCSCRLVVAKNYREAIHEAVGISSEGESNWYVINAPDEFIFPCCETCTVA